MYEELYAPLPDVNAYLERIGLAGEKPEPTVAWLERLVHQQLIHIPFDDMDVWGRGDCPSLAIEDLFNKIIVRRRGGYCYELNSLFHSFLEAIGFETYVVAVNLMGGRPFISPPAHCAVICIIDGEKYFCDVGFGGPVPDGCVKYGGEIYHGYRIAKDGFHTVLEQVNGDEVTRVMLYYDHPFLPVDLVPLNFHVSQRPGSLFQLMLNVNLRREDGSVSISGNKFKLHTATENTERQMTSIDELKEVLPKYFGIPADDPPYRDLDPVKE